MKGPQDIFSQLQGQFGQFVPDMARAAKDDFEAQARASVASVCRVLSWLLAKSLMPSKRYC